MEQEKKYTVYMHTNKINNKSYVGITSKSPKKRWDNGNGYKKQPYFWNAIKKYGWNNFEHIIFMDNLSKADACKMEQLLIALFDLRNRDKGYNYQPGGETGNLGCIMSDEAKRKLSEAKKGKPLTKETRRKMSQAQKERWTEDEKKKRSEQYSGENNPMFGVHRFGERNPMYGKTHSNETKNKISQTKIMSEHNNGTPIVCIETGIVYKNSGDAERKTGILAQTILACCRHDKHRKTAGGYHWLLYSEYIEQQEVVV